jgi:hypothetical protein
MGTAYTIHPLFQDTLVRANLAFDTLWRHNIIGGFFAEFSQISGRRLKWGFHIYMVFG